MKKRSLTASKTLDLCYDMSIMKTKRTGTAHLALLLTPLI